MNILDDLNETWEQHQIRKSKVMAAFLIPMIIAMLIKEYVTPQFSDNASHVLVWFANSVPIIIGAGLSSIVAWLMKKDINRL